MTPQELMQRLRDQSIQWLNMADNLRHRDPSTLETYIVLNFIFNLLEQGAEDKWATAQLIEHHFNAATFQSQKLLPQTPREGVIEFEHIRPPFEVDFFAKHKDL